jgi:hypothetical protein
MLKLIYNPLSNNRAFILERGNKVIGSPRASKAPKHNKVRTQG